MTSDEALDVVADEVTRVALREVIDNGLWDTYLDAELTDLCSSALKKRLSDRAAAGPAVGALAAALRALA